MGLELVMACQEHNNGARIPVSRLMPPCSFAGVSAFLYLLLILTCVFPTVAGASVDYPANLVAMRSLSTSQYSSMVGDPNLLDLVVSTRYSGLVGNASFGRLMANSDFQSFISTSNYPAVFDIPNFTTLVQGGDFSLYYDDPVVGRIVSNVTFTNLLANQDFINVMRNTDNLIVLSDPIMIDLINSPAIDKIVSRPPAHGLLRNASLSNFVAHANLGVLVNSSNLSSLAGNLNFTRLLENPAMEQFVTNINFSAVINNSGFSAMLNALSVGNVIDYVGIGGLLANPDLNNLLSNGSLNLFIGRMNALGIMSGENLAGLFANPNLSALVNMPNLGGLLTNININGVLGNLNLSGLLANINLSSILGNSRLTMMLRLPNIGTLLSNFNFTTLLQNPSFVNLLNNANFLSILSNANFTVALNNLGIAGLINLNFDLNRLFSDTGLLTAIMNPNATYNDITNLLGSYMDENNSSGGGGSAGNGGSYNDGECVCCAFPELMLRQMIKSVMEEDFLKKEIVNEDLKPANKTLADSIREKIILRVLMMGAFIDGQNEVQSLTTMQKLNAKAIRDYQPSEQVCRFGSVLKGLSQSSASAKASQQKYMDRIIGRQTMQEGLFPSFSLTGITKPNEAGRNADKLARYQSVMSRYCDPKESNGLLSALADERGDAMPPLCKALDAANMNADIDAGATLFGATSTPAALSGFGQSDEEQNLMDLGANLYASNLPLNLSASDVNRLKMNGDQGGKNGLMGFMNMRSIVAKHSVAASSFAAIAGMKTAGNGAAKQQLEAVAKELGITDQKDLDKLIGNNPSYYAQMDFLTKKLYQTPNFYANLYDTPANVMRQQTAIKAISLMQDRDIYESLQRSEMLLSVILEVRVAHMQDEYKSKRRDK